MSCICINLPFDLELLDFQLLQPSQHHPKKQQGPSISIFCVIMELFLHLFLQIFIFTNIFIWLFSLGLSSHTHSYWLGSPLVPAGPSAQLGLCFQLNQLGLVCRRLQRIPEKTETHLLLSMCVQIYKWWKLMHLITYHRSLLPLCSLGTYETCETLWSNTNKSFKCWMKQEFLVKFRWVWGFFSSSFLTLLGTIICKLSTIF